VTVSGRSGAVQAGDVVPQLGIRANAGQFVLLVVVNAFVGAVVGVERSILPLLAEAEFGVTSTTAALGFLIGFGFTKAAANLLTGELAGRVGRKRLLLLGWAFGLPVPALLIWAPTWNWVTVANVLLGLNQGFAWSAAVIMKIDLAGRRGRGLAVGLNEFAGYGAVSVTAAMAGYLATSFGPRPAPFLIAEAAAVLGFALSWLFVRDTGAHAAAEERIADTASDQAALPERLLPRFWRATAGHRSLRATSQAGLVNNLNDGVAWGLLPLFFTAHGLDPRAVGLLAGLYPAVWSVTQLGTGALSDRIGRRPLIVGGMLLQAVAFAAFALASGFAAWAAAAVLLGLGTAAVYPTLLAQVGDLVRVRHRAFAVGVYRLWRDLGYVAGALVAGLLTDSLGFRAALAATAALTAASGLAAGRALRDVPAGTNVSIHGRTDVAATRAGGRSTDAG
jgi:MFS family permease